MKLGRIKRLMKLKKVLAVLVVLAVLSSPASVALKSVADALSPSETVLSVDPSVNTANPAPAPVSAQWFTVNFSITNVTNLYSWQLKLRWKLGLLWTTEADITEGPFLQDSGGPGSTFFVKSVDIKHIDIAASLMGPSYPRANGSGVLATASFKAVDVGNCSLELFDTVLYGYDASAPPDQRRYEIAHSQVNATFNTTFPVADFTMSPNPIQNPGHPIVGEIVTFNATPSYDPDQSYRGQSGNGVVSYSWNFGDGVTGTGRIINHTYDGPDLFTVRLNITDDDGETYFKDKAFLVEPRDLVGPYQYCTPDFSQQPIPGYFDTSEFMMGSVAVGVILPESIGTAYNWTDSEISLTVGGIRAGMDWWKSQNPSAHLSFVFDIHERVPTVYEPIQMSEWEDYMWIEDVMFRLNYTAGGAWDRVTRYNNDIRSAFGTDWAFTIFVVDSDPSVNMGNFAEGGYAHAFLGGPWVTMSRFSSWAYNSPSYYDAVPAHEMGHIFYATDEYNGVREYSGYLNASDKDGSFGIMNRNNFYVSETTKLQIGWRDTDEDGILDTLDTHPAVKLGSYPTKIVGSSYQFSGVVVEVPHQNFNPFGQRHNLSLNEIISVEFSIDEGFWSSASPMDGAFDEALEDYKFTVVFPSFGMHTLKVRALNSIGNSREWNFTVENESPHPVASFTHTPSIGIVDEEVVFDGSGSYDPNGTIVSYAWDFGDGTSLLEADPITSHIYDMPGNFTVTLTVTNNKGQIDTTAKLIIVKQRSTISISLNPSTVVLGSSTIIHGAITPNRVGVAVTIQWRMQPWQNWIRLANTITDKDSRYSYVWSPPELGSYEIKVSWGGDEDTLPAENTTTLQVILPPPKIVIDPPQGPVGTKVSIRGYDFSPSTSVNLMFDDQIIGFILADQDGEFNATFNVPVSEVGTHFVKAISMRYYPYEMYTTQTTFTVLDVAPLDLSVDVGSIYFKQETAEFYIQTTFKGTPINVTSIKATLHKPDGTTETLTATQITTGFYKIHYKIKGKGSQTGTYTLWVEANYTVEFANAKGVTIKTFLVKPSWEREAPRIAALSIASTGLVATMFLLWQREKKKFL